MSFCPKPQLWGIAPGRWDSEGCLQVTAPLLFPPCCQAACGWTGSGSGNGESKGLFWNKQASKQPTNTHNCLKGDTPWGNADKNIFPKRKKTHVVFSFCALPSPVWQLVQKWDAPLVQEATGTQLQREQHARLEDAISHSMCQYMSWEGISPRVQEELK